MKYVSYLLIYFLVSRTIFILPIFSINRFQDQPKINIGSDKINVFIVGSSNVHFGYDIDLLNRTNSKYNWVKISYAASAGLAPLVDKLEQIKPQKYDIIIFDLPYNLFDPDWFFRHNKSFYAYLNMSNINRIYEQNPKLFLQWIFQTGGVFFYKEVVKDIKFYLNPSDLNFKQLSDENWKSCNNVYKKERHYIISQKFDEEHIKFIKNLIEKKFPNNISFVRFPEINKNNYSISKKKLNTIRHLFRTINNFEDSRWEDKYMFDLWYHLNKCGSEINSQKIINEISTTKQYTK